MQIKRAVLFLFLLVGCFPKVWMEPTINEKTTAPVFIAQIRDTTPSGFPSDALSAYLSQALNAQGLTAMNNADIAQSIGPDVQLPNAQTSIFITVLRFQWRPVRVVMRVEATNIETAQTQWQVNITYEQRARKRNIFPSELAQIISEQILANTTR